MHAVKLNPYILLGTSIRYVLDVREGLPIRQKTRRDELSLLNHMKQVEAQLIRMGLNVTSQAFQGELGDYLKRLERVPEDATLSRPQADEIVERVKLVADVLKYEATNLQAYIIPDKRLPVVKLLSDVSGLFGECVFTALPDLAQYDFAQAGKCIAFDLPTSAAFHILRGTEGVLRSYHSALMVSAPPPATLLWGPMVADLKKLTGDTPPKELLDNLDNIRVSFRNPTQHPEKRYDIDEAQDLFNLCVDVINRMAKDLFRRRIWDENPF